jgi:hypothetical protein
MIFVIGPSLYPGFYFPQGMESKSNLENKRMRCTQRPQMAGRQMSVLTCFRRCFMTWSKRTKVEELGRLLGSGRILMFWHAG